MTNDCPNTVRKIILHPGFHKTGTTSLQHFLRENLEVLSDYADFYFEDDLGDVSWEARHYGKRPLFWLKERFRAHFRAFLATVPERETIVISCEALSGVMPGYNNLFHRPVISYEPIARPLIELITEELRARFGDAPALTVVFTTRESDSWLKSVFGHVSRTRGTMEGFATFRSAFPRRSDLAREARAITSHIDGIDVMMAPLEVYTHAEFGPATAILDLLDLPEAARRKLVAQERQNVGTCPPSQESFRNQRVSA